VIGSWGREVEKTRSDAFKGMNLIVNGDEEYFEDVRSVSDLLDQLSYEPERVAVEVDREVVSGEAYDEYVLESGDEVEIVTFVGGG